MRIMVTGGAGFIGSHVVDRYVEAGHTVSIVDDLSTGRQENLNPRAVFYKADVRNLSVLEKVFEKESPEIINHHAAQMDVRRSVADPTYDAEVNIIGAINILELMVKHGAERIIYASTGGAVYGEPQALPVAEEHPINPISQYGISKHTVEHYLHLYSLNYGIEYVALRYPNVFGPRQDPHGEAGVIAIFSNFMLKGNAPTIFGGGQQLRDYVFVDDIADANLAALSLGANSILNLGTGAGTSVNQIFATLAKITGFQGAPVYAPSRKGEVYHICLNPALAKETLGWCAKTPFEKGLRITVEFIRSALFTQELIPPE